MAAEKCKFITRISPTHHFKWVTYCISHESFYCLNPLPPSLKDENMIDKIYGLYVPSSVNVEVIKTLMAKINEIIDHLNAQMDSPVKKEDKPIKHEIVVKFDMSSYIPGKGYWVYQYCNTCNCSSNCPEIDHEKNSPPYFCGDGSEFCIACPKKAQCEKESEIIEYAKFNATKWFEYFNRKSCSPLPLELGKVYDCPSWSIERGTSITSYLLFYIGDKEYYFLDLKNKEIHKCFRGNIEASKLIKLSPDQRPYRV